MGGTPSQPANHERALQAAEGGARRQPAQLDQAAAAEHDGDHAQGARPTSPSPARPRRRPSRRQQEAFEDLTELLADASFCALLTTADREDGARVARPAPARPAPRGAG